MSHQQNRFDFFDDIDAAIGDPSNTYPQIAVLVIDVATPTQYEELVRALGQVAADSFEDASAESVSVRLPAHSKLYGLSAARFGCVLRAGTQRNVEEILDRFSCGIRRPTPAGPSIPLATSIGIGVAYYPHHGVNAAKLFQAAVSGAHESLDSGTIWCPYNPAFDEASLRAIHLLYDIVPALAAKNQLRLVYQPKTDISTGRCIGAEALLRWNHPALGPIPPDEFVPLIERTTLVNAMNIRGSPASGRPLAGRWFRAPDINQCRDAGLVRRPFCVATGRDARTPRRPAGLDRHRGDGKRPHERSSPRRPSA